MLQNRKIELREKGIFSGITERRVRGQSKLITKQSKNNIKFSKVRALVKKLKKLKNILKIGFKF